MTNLQCPNCGSYEVSTPGEESTPPWLLLWPVHIILVILTSGAWLLVLLAWYFVIKPVLGKKSHQYQYKCKACGYHWG